MHVGSKGLGSWTKLGKVVDEDDRLNGDTPMVSVRRPTDISDTLPIPTLGLCVEFKIRSKVHTVEK